MNRGRRVCRCGNEVRVLLGSGTSALRRGGGHRDESNVQTRGLPLILTQCRTISAGKLGNYSVTSGNFDHLERAAPARRQRPRRVAELIETRELQQSSC
jgi:hypothetical protein